MAPSTFASIRTAPFAIALVLALGSIGLVGSQGCGDDVAADAASGSAGAATGTGGQGATGATGTATGTGATGGRDPQCAIAGDCPAPEEECLTAACNVGSCGVAPLPGNTPAANQVKADCQQAVCDGAGAVQSIPDDLDVSDDGNECTADACVGGAPQHTPVAAGTACGAGKVCTAGGDCAECNVPADCPGTDDACQHRVCAANVCGVELAPTGTAVPIQVTGDCKLAICDGAGATTTSNDDADIPDDNNVCTTDACNAGTPSNTPDAGAPCGAAGTCDAQGVCQAPACIDPSECPGTDDFCKTRTCNAGTCGFSFTPDGTPLPSQTTGDCLEVQCNGAGGTKSVAHDADLPVDALECTLDTCNNGFPSHSPKPLGTPCSQGVCGASGQCVECNTVSDCPAPAVCTTATCNAAICGVVNVSSGTVCAPGSCSSGVQTNPDTCNGSGSCVDGGTTSCAPYICGPSSCTSSCFADGGCASGFSCDTLPAKCTNGPKCTDYCNDIMAHCTGTHGQYSAIANCVAACEALPPGSIADLGGNTVGCRAYHGGGPSQGDPATHCTHAGPGGDGVCGANCEGFCSIALGVCTGANTQYASLAACMAECQSFPTGVPYNTTVTSGNSLACRLYHLNAATVDPGGHCGHIKLASPTCF